VVLLPKGFGWAQAADAAAACQNMLLAATDAGLGSCWFGSIERGKLASLLGIPDEWHIFSLIALGYPAETPRVVEGEDTAVRRGPDGTIEVPKRPLESVLSVDRFGGQAGG
jgi:nitroreductase